MSYDSSTVTVSGGTVLGAGLNATGSSMMTVIGRDFAVDGDPVPFGLIEAMFGDLSGVYPSGEAFLVYFRHNGLDGFYTGTIVLAPIPEPSTTLLLAFGLMALAAGRRRR
jgi:hypothetical protein